MARFAGPTGYSGVRQLISGRVSKNLTLQSLTPSEEVDDIHVDSIHCVFCLADDEDHANEHVILR